MFNGLQAVLQLFTSAIIAIYFWSQMQGQRESRRALEKESDKELIRLRRMNAVHLSMPLTEKARPSRLNDIVGQEDGIRALRAALCSPNPQHVLIYGPPGVGKTAAARVVLEEAKRCRHSPFSSTAPYVELDACTLRFDDRGIADPLIGSVHDPIYQGAGAYGPAGVPQPKPGAVTKAHGGLLVIDEIGELHPVQMNKLLKVLEDRRVFPESAYYASGDQNIPPYIHEIFQKGLPADFRLVGATTRSPEELPPALRSRCIEIYFRGLGDSELFAIAEGAAKRSGFGIGTETLHLICDHAQNGRDAINMLQLGASVALSEERRVIGKEDMEWVIEAGRHLPKLRQKVNPQERIGVVNALAVSGSSGTLLTIEVTARPGNGELRITGIIEEEEYQGGGKHFRKQSSARASVENILTVLETIYYLPVRQYDLHINIPSAPPVDGPSAGVAILYALYSAITNTPIPGDIAMTGEISLHGGICPVGGVSQKLDAAEAAGVTEVFIPADNYRSCFEHYAMKVTPLPHITKLIKENPKC